jgi:nitrate reductase gamma subunit
LRQIFFLIGAVLFARSLLSLFHYFATCLLKVYAHAAVVGIEAAILALANDILGFFCGWIGIAGSLPVAIQRFRKTRLEDFSAEPLSQAIA